MSFFSITAYILPDLSDIDFLEDSTTESLLFSGDEYNQDLDSLTMEDFQDEEEDSSNEIVRCICEMDEENGFMIQVGMCEVSAHFSKKKTAFYFEEPRALLDALLLII